MGGAALIYMPEKERTCPWKQITGNPAVNLYVGLQKGCTNDCGLWDESINRCAIISIARDMRILRLAIENKEKEK